MIVGTYFFRSGDDGHLIVDGYVANEYVSFRVAAINDSSLQILTPTGEIHEVTQAIDFGNYRDLAQHSPETARLLVEYGYLLGGTT